MKPTFDVKSVVDRIVFKPRDRLRAVVVGLVIAIVCLLAVIANQIVSSSTRFRLSDFEVGKLAGQDVISGRSLTYTDDEATEALADDEAAKVPPVFQVRSDLVEQSMQQFSTFAGILVDLVSKHVTPDNAYNTIQAAFPDLFARDKVSALLRDANLVNILPIAAQVLDDAMSDGILALQESQFQTMPETVSLVRIRNGRHEAETRNLEGAITKRSLPTRVRAVLSPRDLGDQDTRSIIFLVTAFAQEDAFYDFRITQQNRNSARADVAPVIGRITKGEFVVRKGTVVTPAIMARLRALQSYSTAVSARGVAGTICLLLLLFVLAFTLLSRAVIRRTIEGKHVYLLSGLYLFYMIVATLIGRGDLTPEWLPAAVMLPTALVAMVVSILLDLRVGVVFSLICALSLFILSGTSAYSFLFAFLSGTAATFVVTGAERRIDLIRASLELAVANGLILTIFGLFMNYELSWFFIAAGWGFLNGFLCGILNLGLLPIFEHLLNAPTPFRLMELSDMNSPMLKRMLTLAPGTYSHSVSVAHLAESACRAIGANALLARVGAYYHDIGKIDQSEYFVENQTNGNKHDELKPSLSAAVIKSHVKIGIERAKELGLPQEVIDIIAQHHGSGLISYFYARAVKDQKDSRVNPEDFSYPGTPPASREAAVVMLADTVEAASRTLKKPTVAKLERFIWSSIMEKFTSGQMNESDLTFRDLEVIKRTFLQILAGHFHSRIEYPDAREALK